MRSPVGRHVGGSNAGLVSCRPPKRSGHRTDRNRLDAFLIKLTVIYDLLPDADHDDFIARRTSTTQAANLAEPGVVKSDFYAIREGWPEKETPYRYITEMYYTDMETFRRGFFDEQNQAALLEKGKTVGEIMFLISEEIQSEENPNPTG
jgi:hypothetical protein